jgi:hypothetical protein
MVDIVDEIIRIGLMIGAVFQLICIAAVIWVPAKDQIKSSSDSSDGEDMAFDNNLYLNQSLHKHQHSSSHNSRRNRHEKKKRR